MKKVTLFLKFSSPQKKELFLIGLHWDSTFTWFKFMMFTFVCQCFYSANIYQTDALCYLFCFKEELILIRSSRAQSHNIFVTCIKLENWKQKSQIEITNMLLIVTCSKAHLPPFYFNKNINSYVHLPQKLVIKKYSKDVYKRFKISICVQLENKYQPNF